MPTYNFSDRLQAGFSLVVISFLTVPVILAVWRDEVNIGSKRILV
jgi:hypothetical protein